MRYNLCSTWCQQLEKRSATRYSKTLAKKMEPQFKCALFDVPHETIGKKYRIPSNNDGPSNSRAPWIIVPFCGIIWDNPPHSWIIEEIIIIFIIRGNTVFQLDGLRKMILHRQSIYFGHGIVLCYLWKMSVMVAQIEDMTFVSLTGVAWNPKIQAKKKTTENWHLVSCFPKKTPANQSLQPQEPHFCHLFVTFPNVSAT